jgi:hypothetical protein
MLRHRSIDIRGFQSSFEEQPALSADSVHQHTVNEIFNAAINLIQLGRRVCPIGYVVGSAVPLLRIARSDRCNQCVPIPSVLSAFRSSLLNRWYSPTPSHPSVLAIGCSMIA